MIPIYIFMCDKKAGDQSQKQYQTRFRFQRHDEARKQPEYKVESTSARS
jgi:hypothetical protein